MPVHFVELNFESLIHLFCGGSRKRGGNMSIEKYCIFVGNYHFTDIQNHILILAKYCMGIS